jgi:hypothetical protein
MSVKIGGYQSGCTYRWYREMGHNPLSACFMLIPASAVFWLVVIEAFVLAFLMGAGAI